MAVIVDAAGRRWTLGPRTLIGRSPACAVVVSSTLASGEHASIVWHRDAWWIRDLGSRNGTWVDRERIAPGARCLLAVGSRISLGAASQTDLVVEDLAYPALRAVELRSCEVAIGMGDVLHLGGEDGAPPWSVYDDGARWVAERAGVVHEIGDHAELEENGRIWRVELPPRLDAASLQTTEGAMPVDAIEAFAMRFRVSRNEEDVRVALVHRVTNDEIVLSPRAFHYMLATLARRRLQDRRDGVPRSEEGWTHADDLARMLASTKPRINLDVCRARQQLAQARISGAGRIIERRPTSGQLRIGVEDVDVSSE